MTTPSNGDGRRPHVSIIVAAWNGLDFTRACLDSIRRNTDFPDYEIVVVDNGSTDGTRDYLEEQKNLTVLSQEENLGFAKGNNIGMMSVRADSDVILLNNDTLVLQPDWISRLQETAHSSPDVGPVGCRLVRPNGVLQHAGAFMPVETLWGQQIGAGERDVGQYQVDRTVESVVFACVYLKRELLRTVGLLEEAYVSYFEDSDYCLRAQEAGFRTVCCGSVTVLHHEHVSTTVNEVPHAPLFERAQRVFRRRWAEKLNATRYWTKIGWHSLLNFTTGYAISSRQLVAALDRAGVRVSYRYLYGAGTHFSVEEPEAGEDYVVNMIRGRPLEGDAPQVVYGLGNSFERNCGSYKIGFTMLETDRIPEEWVRQANLMDEVWCPSRFNRETFRASGVKSDIHVIPLGVDPDHFNPRINTSRISNCFVFLSVFEWGERKAPEALLRAFNREFRATEPVLLVCKILNSDAGVNVHEEIRALELDPLGGRIHVSLNEVLPTYQLGALYRSADCFVLPTRGEGWSMPIIEAMACGLPVIATNWSAYCDFMTAENAYPVEVESLIPAVAKCPYYKGFRWAHPSAKDLRRLLRRVFANPGEAREKGRRASEDVLASWTWDKAAEKIVARLEAISPTKTPEKHDIVRHSATFGGYTSRS